MCTCVDYLLKLVFYLGRSPELRVEPNFSNLQIVWNAVKGLGLL
jgi:hypothetical protein